MNKQHNNGKEYAHDLIFTIMEADLKAEQPLPSDLLEYWGQEIHNECVARFELYINNEVDDYRLSDEEIMDLLKEANSKLISDTLITLVERGDISMSVGDDGEILYSATEQGKSRL